MIGNHLKERSYLVWNFYNANGEPATKSCPFMENVNIKESSKSRMGTHSPIGRNGSIYVHMGSDAREFTLSFNITLPNIIEHGVKTDKATGGFLDFDGAMNRALKKSDQIRRYVEGVKDGPKTGRAKTYEEYVRETDKIFQGYLDDQEVAFQTRKVFNEGARNLMSFAQFDSFDDPRITAIASVMSWLNLIRISTMTHSQKPWLGPPILRLTHGIVYQNVPCIARSWNVEVDGAAGYDNRTLMPRVLKVSMQLSEVRLNNEKFDQQDNPDGLIGWDVPVEGFLSLNEVLIYDNLEEGP